MLKSSKNLAVWHFLSFCSAKLVDLALASRKIFDGEGFNYIKECFASGTLHLIGLLSDGGVHSRLDQLQVTFFALLQWAVPAFLLLLISLPFAVATKRC